MGTYRFFQNVECEYFPCHETKDRENFNCMFCYCPLYTLGRKCGGDFTYSCDGIKDCSRCILPHTRGGFDYIMAKWDDIAAVEKKSREED